MSDDALIKVETGEEKECPECDGGGMIMCPKCNGMGVIDDRETIRIRADTPCWNCGEVPGVAVLRGEWLCSLCMAYSVAIECGKGQSDKRLPKTRDPMMAYLHATKAV